MSAASHLILRTLLFTLAGMGNHSAAPTPLPPRRRLTITGALAVIGAATVLLSTAVALVESGTNAATATVPRPDKTVVVVMENHSYSQVITAPYIASLAKAGANMTDSHGVRHPSEPNYLALWSGSTQGLTDDSCPHTYTGGSLGQQLLSAGQSVAGYFENLPTAGSTVCSASGGYARKHNPLADFPATTGDGTNKPFIAWPAGNFSALPDVSLVVPNLCNDMHDCSVTTGDNWLKAHIDPYVQWAKTHNSLLVLTFDEDDFTAANHIPTILVGPMVSPGTYPETVNHYNVLHTIEAAHGLPQLGAAAAPITDVWAGAAPTTTAPPSTPATTTAVPSTTPPTTTAPGTSSSSTSVVSSSATASPSGSQSSSTSQPPSTSTATPTPTPTPTGPRTQRPIRAAFYYGWFPETEHWASHYTPAAGKYDSSDPAVVTQQVRQAKVAGLDAFITSWWGQGSKTDQRLPLMLDTATAQGFHVTPYYEKEGFGNPTADQLGSDLTYLAGLADRYPQTWLRVGGKPVLFVYNADDTTCAVTDRWKAANQGRFYLAMKVFDGYRTCPNQPDAWHQYGPASAEHSFLPWSFTVSPGFWRFDESTPRLVRDLARFKTNLAHQVASGALWQLTTSWNEWGEGTGMEPTVEFGQDYTQAMAGAYHPIDTPPPPADNGPASLIENPPAGTTVYGLHDTAGHTMDTVKVAADPSTPGRFLAIYHWTTSTGASVGVATSTDLRTWAYRRTLDTAGSQPYLAFSPRKGPILAVEGTPSPHLRFRYWTSVANMLGTGAPYRTYNAPRTLSNCAEGTPSIGAVTYANSTSTITQGSVIEVRHHYFADCATDREAVGTLTNFGTWTTRADPALDQSLTAAGAAGKHGDRDTFTYQGAPWLLAEGQVGTLQRMADWRLFLHDGTTARQVTVHTRGGSTAQANPAVTVLTFQGQRVLLVTVFLPASGAAAGEAGQMLFWTPMPSAPAAFAP